MKIHPVGAKLFHVETDITKLKVTFCNFLNVPKNVTMNTDDT
jgi:hypothetical protein